MSVTEIEKNPLWLVLNEQERCAVELVAKNADVELGYAPVDNLPAWCVEFLKLNIKTRVFVERVFGDEKHTKLRGIGYRIRERVPA